MCIFAVCLGQCIFLNYAFSVNKSEPILRAHHQSEFFPHSKLFLKLLPCQHAEEIAFGAQLQALYGTQMFGVF